MADLTLYSVKGSQLTTTEVDNNFLNSGQGFRNRVINGNQSVSQRYGTTVVTVPNSANTITDMNIIASYTASNFAAQQVPLQGSGAQVVTGSAYCMRITNNSVSTAPVAGAYNGWTTKIEGINISDAMLGSIYAKDLAVSLVLVASVAGTYAIRLSNGANDRSYVHLVNVTTGWQRISFTVPGDTSGTWAIDNTIGLVVSLDLGAGSNYETATTDTWIAGDYRRTAGCFKLSSASGEWVQITDVQIEVGSVATPFERRSYGLELALCQRYLNVLSGGDLTAICSATASTIGWSYKLPVTMRAIPTISDNFNDANYVGTSPTGAQWNVQTGGVAYTTKTGTFTFSKTPLPNKLLYLAYGATLSQSGSNFLTVGTGMQTIASAEL